MPGFAVAVLVVTLIAAVIGGSILFGAPVFAIPIVFAILVVWGGARVATRRNGAGIGEEDVSGEKIEFDDRDRQTLTPSEGRTP
jgi:hypothetical protein